MHVYYLQDGLALIKKNAKREDAAGLLQKKYISCIYRTQPHLHAFMAVTYIDLTFTIFIPYPISHVGRRAAMVLLQG